MARVHHESKKQEMLIFHLLPPTQPALMPLESLCHTCPSSTTSSYTVTTAIDIRLPHATHTRRQLQQLLSSYTPCRNALRNSNSITHFSCMLMLEILSEFRTLHRQVHRIVSSNKKEKLLQVLGLEEVSQSRLGQVWNLVQTWLAVDDVPGF
ncbi:hypothetical protein PIB30_064974, partial [Stylosanthes scabra]|nr:hypothetical protein [Stylosanthes scabra]